MEKEDVFTQQGSEIGNEDPFAGSDFGDWEQEGQPAPSTEQPTPIEPLPPEEPPVAEDGQAAQEPPEQQAPPAETAPQAPSAPAGEAAPPPLAPPPPPSPSQAATAAREGGESAAVPPASQSPASAATAATAPGAPPEPERVAGASPLVELEEEVVRREQDDDVPVVDPQTAASHGESLPPEPSSPTTSSAASNGSASVASMPEETKDKRGRVTHRRYVLLRAEGNGKFTQLTWYEDKQRKLVKREAKDAKRQTVVLARGTEEALKFGYAVEGGPVKGADLVAVAAAYFQVRHVAPQPPEPMRQRLSIS